MLVTKDKYELPLAVADTRKELGKMLGVSPVTIANSITRARKDGHKSIANDINIFYLLSKYSLVK